MSVIDLLKEVVETIAVYEASVWEETRHASVGILIAGAKQSPSICFIRRAKWKDDPWSEHIAFPGGSRMADEDVLQTLRRELDEEIGWVVEDSQPPVRLPQLRIRLAGRERLLLLDAFVYRIEGDPPILRCGPEVESAFWIPVAELWSLDNLDHHTLAKLVASQTGLSQTDAENRVSEVFAQLQQETDATRSAVSRLFLWLFIALLIGAFCASFAATIGGRQRDRVQLV